MSLPQPKTALNNACSVIFNNTLYTYSTDAFQSLRLEPGAEWEELPQGEKVTGAVCVGSTTGVPSTSAFFVVGGTGGSDEYQGLQKYTYATGQWETIKLAMKVTHQRIDHAAVYINSTDSILVYGGFQDGSGIASSQTFTIGASAPHAVEAYDSYAPASLKPILLPWSTSEAVLVGGSTTNTNVMLFNSADRKWVDSGATLASPLQKDTSSIQAVLMTGDDGSKHLVTFDMSVSPNLVKRTVLYSGPGIPVSNAAPVRRRTARRNDSSPDQNERRDATPLTVNNWPAYNSTLAPTTTRSNFAFAQGPDGTVVIAGGTSSDDVLCMFDARQNSWANAQSRLGEIKLLSTESSTTSSSSSTATSTTSTSTSIASSTSVSATVTGATQTTSTATASPVAAVSDSSGPPLNTILGAVLGGFFGLAVLLALIYLCIKRQKRRQAHIEAGHIRRASGASSSEKDGVGFAKDSLAYGRGPPGVFRGHQPQGSHGSVSSMAILMGRAGQRKLSSDNRRDSSDSTFRAFKSTISKPILQTTEVPAPALRSPQAQQTARDEKGVSFAASTAEPKPRNITNAADKQGTTRRSSGWNRYWSGGSALNLLGFGSGNGNSNSNNNNNGNAPPQRATLVSERSSNYSSQNRMTQDSATVPPLFPAAAEPRMSLSRVTTHSPTIAVYNDKLLTEGMSGRIETQRPVSAVSDMSASAYSSGIPESVQEAWDPTAASRPWGADRSLNDSFAGMYATPLAPASSQQGLKPPVPAPAPLRPAPPRQQQQAPVRDDMSWLNLGAS